MVDASSASRARRVYRRATTRHGYDRGRDGEPESRQTQIDDYDQAMELVRKMEAHLPIPARPTSRLVRSMQERGAQLPSQLEIKHVLYAGDEGGISCDVTLPDGKEAIVCSITHLQISRNHPLGSEIRAYQEERKRKLALFGARPASYTLYPDDLE